MIGGQSRTLSPIENDHLGSEGDDKVSKGGANESDEDNGQLRTVLRFESDDDVGGNESATEGVL